MSFLKGVKVVDFTHAYAGPFCTMSLCDYGAEVIKVERVDTGDQTRSWGPFKNGHSAYYCSFNRGKKNITINIASKEGQEIIFELVKDADIVCSNFKAGTLEKYGIGYEDIKKIKPDVIYASLSGYGNRGEIASHPAYDNVVQAMSGVMDLNGFPGKRPTKIGPAIGDSYSGLMLLLGVMAAFYHRQQTGEGQKVDVTMLGSLYTLSEYPILEYANHGKMFTRNGNRSMYYAPGDVYKTKEGYVALSVKNNAMWKTFCDVLDLPGLCLHSDYIDNDARLANSEKLTSELEKVFAAMTADEIEKAFENTEVPVAAVMGIVEALDDPHLNARNMVIEVDDPGVGNVKLVGNPIRLSGIAPRLDLGSPLFGEDTTTMLADLGYSEERIKEAQQKCII